MSTSPDVFVVFYCWQSDTPQSHSRHLIREALDAAADRLSRDGATGCRIQIDSDTLNETGMCDIPATILRKLENADAVVADLTFIAKADRKHCSNPNVLFELGFAFHAIGPERLICVMNESHGPRHEQIFDLAHRRHPISFSSPATSGSRKETIEKLSKELERALRPIFELGPSGVAGGDDQRRHESERARIDNFWEASRKAATKAARLIFTCRPLRYRERRWASMTALESLARRRAIHHGRHEFPPQQIGTAAMEWGIYNDTYGDAWALTYAGQLWLAIEIGGGRSVKLSERDSRLSPEPPTNSIVEEDHWILRWTPFFGQKKAIP